MGIKPENKYSMYKTKQRKKLHFISCNKAIASTPRTREKLNSASHCKRVGSEEGGENIPNSNKILKKYK